MNKKLILAFALIGTIFATSCEKDKGPAPTNIDASTLTAKPEEGAVVLRWKIPEGANYKYVRVDYTIPRTEITKDIVFEEDHRSRLASIYENVVSEKAENGNTVWKSVDKGYKSITIDNLLNKFGELTFKLTPVSADGVDGETISIKATANALPKTVEYVDKKAETIDPATQAWTDAQEATEGPLANLFDGSDDTFFHMNWHNPKDFPHYIVVKVEKPIAAMSFAYTCRNHGGKHNPKRMQVWVSKDFDGTNFVPSAFNAVKVGEELKELPGDQKASYTSETLNFNGEKYQYVWFEILESTSGQAFVALAKWNVFSYTKQVFDPETGETIKE